jgi:hypothetical protein
MPGTVHHAIGLFYRVLASVMARGSHHRGSPGKGILARRWPTGRHNVWSGLGRVTGSADGCRERCRMKEDCTMPHALRTMLGWALAGLLLLLPGEGIPA